ncbi:MAG: hypothetical protein IJ019_04210 [Alphaproteobacteria bacterium]|nr:hypothetical protein [Alphaproteobacteria bacterium]
MIVNLLLFIVLSAIGFLFSVPIFFYVNKNINPEYAFKKDAWVYMWLFSLIGVLCICYFTPDFYDIVISLNYKYLLLPFGLSALIYIAFLFEINKLLYSIMAISSVIITSIIPENITIFDNYISLPVERMIIFSSLFLITFFSKILNGMSAVFGIFIITVLFGISLITLLGGLPVIFGIITSLLCGMWLNFLRYNWYPSEIFLNDGACASAGFLVACLLLYSCFEYAAGSMFILATYLFAEIILVMTRQYIFRIKEPDFYYNTSYYICYMKDISAQAILMALVRIGIINVIFASFQIYAPNLFSLPMFVLVADLWLLNMLYNATEEKTDIRQINQALVEDVKDGLKIVKKSLNKRKRQ